MITRISPNPRVHELTWWRDVSRPEEPVLRLLEWAQAYRNFVAAFVALYEPVYAETTLKRVKELDDLPRQPRRGITIQPEIRTVC